MFIGYAFIALCESTLDDKDCALGVQIFCNVFIILILRPILTDCRRAQWSKCKASGSSASDNDDALVCRRVGRWRIVGWRPRRSTGKSMPVWPVQMFAYQRC